MEIIFWNLNGLSSLKNQSRLLNYLDWDVAILIEVTKESYKELCNEMNYESSELSLNISNTPSEKKRGLGCFFKAICNHGKGWTSNFECT